MDVAFLNMDRPYNKDLKVNTQGVFFVPPKDIYFLLNIIMIILDSTCIVNYKFVFLAFFFL